MFSKTTLLSTLIALLVYNILFYLIYGLLIADFLPPDPASRDWTLHLIGTLVITYILTLIYLNLKKINNDFLSGVVFGFKIGVIFTVGEGLIFTAIGTMSLTQWAVYALSGLVFYSLVGGSIGITSKLVD
ncbi:MAG: hypothetical protein OXC03_05270 [Flavobacteriaceae bacterium]|nr:hypothetical protein [Flavobacteriaceae bacterium]